MRADSVLMASVVCGLALAGASDIAGAQSLESRVAAAPNGLIRMTYATRAGVCGGGRDGIGIGQSLYISSTNESHGHWSGMRCTPGPARVELAVRSHEVTGVRTHVGGAWSATDEQLTDLGTVGAADAARLLVALAERSESARSARSLMLGAAIADSADVAPAFLKIARDASRAGDTRRSAIWLYGVTAPTDVAATNLSALARDASLERRMRETAVAALADLPDGAGVTTVIDIATHGDDIELRGKAAFWLGQADDPRARKTLRAIIEDEDTPEKVRSEAIFALSQGEASAEDVTFLESAYTRLTSESLKERVLFAISQIHDEHADRWLLDVARDDRQTIHARKQALFWAGQGNTPLAELARLYDGISEPAIKEQLIFVLSQRSESAAVDKLIAIAKSDSDRAMRKKALFWLGQKDDPRVTAMLTDLISR